MQSVTSNCYYSESINCFLMVSDVCEIYLICQVGKQNEVHVTSESPNYYRLFWCETRMLVFESEF
jgi:hypothetical protein